MNKIRRLIEDKKRKKPLKRHMKYPSMQELIYRKYLTSVIVRKHRKIKAWLRKNAQPFRLAAQEELRSDTIDEDIEKGLLFLKEDIAAFEAAGLLDDLFNQIDRHNKSQMQKQVKSLSTFAPEVELTAKGTRARLFIRNNIALIKDLDANMSMQLESAIIRNIVQDKSKAELTADIGKIMRVSKARAKRIAAHQVASANSAMTQSRSEDMGLDRYIWLAVGDKKTRPTHMERDGQEYTWKNGADGVHPGEEVNCRCLAEVTL